ncbi:hypothetical protein [Escherichia coli]|nr:hypothetical protein [Escherichia coli]
MRADGKWENIGEMK